mmetsp:Transcript_76882/g.172544  ORF Transcript_76882/g.172544 Transcript_76882/m.172544 type:complete len:226 (+) Transcript_76882:2-679(+)
MNDSPTKASQGAVPVLVYYHVPSDGDEADVPNAFPVVKQGGGLRLRDIRSKFPLPGTYHFRFKMKFGDSTVPVWMDVTNEDSQVPMVDGKIVAKVVRLSWDQSASQPKQQAQETAASVPASATAARAPPPASSTQRRAPAADVFPFDDDGPQAAVAAAPAAPTGVPSAPRVLGLAADDPFGGGPTGSPVGGRAPPAATMPVAKAAQPPPPPGRPGQQDEFDMLFT